MTTPTEDLTPGDRVILTGGSWGEVASGEDLDAVYTVCPRDEWIYESGGLAPVIQSETGLGWVVYVAEENDFTVTRVSDADANPVNPDHYKFPNGVEVIQISQYLSSLGGQAVQYISRSTRIDGKNKGNPVEDLDKAMKILAIERQRLAEETE